MSYIKLSEALGKYVQKHLNKVINTISRRISYDGSAKWRFDLPDLQFKIQWVNINMS